MTYLKDIRLWATCLLTVALTSLFGVTFHGALGTPSAADGHSTPGVTVQAPQHPLTALTGTTKG